MKVLVGALQSAEGQAAIERAADEARSREGSLHLVGYVPNPKDEESSDRFELDRRAAEERAEKVAAGLREEGLEVAVHVPLGASSPAEAILRVARDEQVDLIVIGMRRRSRVGKLVLGSNAQDILLAADAPVLSVKVPGDG